MKTSIATVSISGDLSEKLAAIAAAGFDGVEIFEADLLTYDATPAEVGRMVRDAGLELNLFQPFRDFEGMPEPQRTRAFDRAERKFDLMGELGADLILVCSNTSTVSLGGIDRAAEDLRALGERAAARGIRVGHARLVIDTDREVILGATFVGPDVDDLLQAATIAVVGEVPIARLWHAVPAYPTVSEVWLRLLEAHGRQSA